MPTVNPIIQKFITEVILNSDLEEISEKDQIRIEQFLLEVDKQAREETLKNAEKALETAINEHEIRTDDGGELMNEYTELMREELLQTMYGVISDLQHQERKEE